MDFYSTGGYYCVQDWTKLIEKQNIYYKQLKQVGILDKKINLDVIKDLLSLIDNELKNSTFPPKQDCVNIENYNYRNKMAIKFYCIYVCYGTCLMRLYGEIFSASSTSFIKTINCYPNELNLKDRIVEIDTEIRKYMHINVHGKKKSIYGTTMLAVSIIERGLINNLVNITLKNLFVKLNKKQKRGEITIDSKYEKYYRIGLNAYLLNKYTDAFEDVEDIDKKIVEMIIKYLDINSRQKKDLDNLINNKSYTLGSMLNNTFAKEYIEEDALKLFKILFNIDELNLRNDIMHCNTHKPYEPSEYAITTTFYHLLNLVLTHSVFK